MADTDARPNARLQRIAFRAWRRGFREADMVLGPFADRVAPELSDAELTDLESLLMIDDDHRLYAWIIGSEPTPAEYETPVMARIRAFMREHVATAVVGGIG